MKYRRTVAVGADGTVYTAARAVTADEDRDQVWDGPCEPWPIDPACCPDWPADPADWTEQHRAAAEIATDVLWRATAGRYGLCEEVIRPCRSACAEPGLFGGPLLSPYIDNGRWFNRACGCTTGCHCGTLCSVPIPGPVAEILEVRLDGKPITSWALHRRPGTAELVRTDEGEAAPLTMSVKPGSDPTGMTVSATLDNSGLGPVDTLDFGDGTILTDVPEDVGTPHQYASPGTYRIVATDAAEPDPGQAGQCWPMCQNLLLPDTEPDTFSVRYLRGRPVPAGGIRAVSRFACEIFKQCTGQKGCRLPERVKTVTREGVTYEMLDTGEWLDSGRTGLNDVDQWIASVNPRALRTPPAVYSLDLPGAPLVEGRYAPRGGLT